MMDWMTGVHLSEFKNSDPIVANVFKHYGILHVSNTYIKKSSR
jgi:hypothetical protein